MPFSIRKVGKNKYQVYNTATGEIHSKGTSKKKAEGQFRLLQRAIVGDLEGGDLHGNLLKMQQGLHLAGEPFRLLGLPNPADLGDGIGQALGETIRTGKGRRKKGGALSMSDYLTMAQQGASAMNTLNEINSKMKGGIGRRQRMTRKVGRLPNPPMLPIVEVEEDMPETIGMPPRIPSPLRDYQLVQKLKSKLVTVRKRYNELQDDINTTRIYSQRAKKIDKFVELGDLMRDLMERISELDPYGEIVSGAKFLQKATGEESPLNYSYYAHDTGREITGLGIRMRGGVLDPSEPYMEGETDSESDDEAEVGDVADDPLGQPHVWNGQEWVPIAPMEEPDFDNEIFGDDEEGLTDDESDDEVFANEEEEGLTDDEMEGNGRRMRGGGLPEEVQQRISELRENIQDIKNTLSNPNNTLNEAQRNVQRRRIAFFQDTINRLKDPKQTMVATGTCGIRRMNAVAPVPVAVPEPVAVAIPDAQVTVVPAPTGEIEEILDNLDNLRNNMEFLDRVIDSYGISSNTRRAMQFSRQLVEDQYDALYSQYQSLLPEVVAESVAEDIPVGRRMPTQRGNRYAESRPATVAPAPTQTRPPAPTQTGQEYQPRRFL